MKAFIHALLSSALLAGTVALAQSEPDGRAVPAYYEEAIRLFSERAFEAAIIELKNGLQQAPGHVSSRVLLGDAYFRLGELSAAEDEYRRALRLGADEALVLPKLGNVLLVLRKHAEIVEVLSVRRPSGLAGAEILSILGQAQYELGQLVEADLSFRQAASLAPDRPEPLLGRALVLMAERELAEAEELVDEAIRRAPEHAEPRYRKAQLQLAYDDHAGALASLDQAIERRPDHLGARVLRSRLYLALERNEEALGDAQYVRDSQPGDPHAAFLAGQALLRLGEDEAGSAAVAESGLLLENLDEAFILRDAATLHLAAVVNYSQANFAQAERYIEQYLESRPYHTGMLKLLVKVRLGRGDAEGATEVAHRLEALHSEDPEILSLLGQAYLHDQRYVQASQALERAAGLRGGERGAGFIVQQALSYFGAGRQALALEELEAAHRAEPGSLEAGILLTFVQLRSDDIGAARKTVQTLLGFWPSNPVVLNASGLVERVAGNEAKARAAFESAVALDKSFVTASLHLADMDLEAGREEQAAARYQEIVKTNPDLAGPYIGLSQLASVQGDAAQAVHWLERAVIADPALLAPQLELLEHYLDNNRVYDALHSADALMTHHPKDPRALVGVSKVYLQSRTPDAALTTLRNASRYAGYDGPVLLEVAHAQFDANDVEGAVWTLEKARQSASRAQATTALVRLHTYQGETALAKQIAGELASEPEHAALGNLLRGEILLEEGDGAGALEAYRLSLQQQRGTAAVLGMYNSHRFLGEDAEAIALLEGWTAEHPRDLGASKALMLGYIAGGMHDEALWLGERLIVLDDADPEIFASLARLYQLGGDPRARKTAERALDIAPGSPVALDTLGWILVREGEADRGIGLIREALVRASTNPLIRYHLAVALAELGRDGEARSEVAVLLRDHPDVEWIEEIRSLQSRLSSG